MSEWHPWQGVLTIARFNWPLYAAGAGVMAGALLVVILNASAVLTAFGWFVLLGATHFTIGSLLVSHVIYDRSDLYRWQWLERALRKTTPRSVIVCHAGFDEVSRDLFEQLKPAQFHVLDHFDEIMMSEPSVRRARHLFPPQPETLAAPFDRWPINSASADVVFGVLAIHELRSDRARTAWFLEAVRCLKPGGQIVLAEHTRDVANFLAFGPGFLHFHSVATWRRSWTAAGLICADMFRVTPWIRVFILTASA